MHPGECGWQRVEREREGAEPWQAEGWARAGRWDGLCSSPPIMTGMIFDDLSTICIGIETYFIDTCGCGCCAYIARDRKCGVSAMCCALSVLRAYRQRHLGEKGVPRGARK